MASALTVLLLGCWLAEQFKALGQLPAPGPSISISPSGVISVGEAVTIHCQCWCRGRRLWLFKDAVGIRELEVAGAGGEFTIRSARREDTGRYSCRSYSTSEPPYWSEPSDVVRIIVAELRYPKPSISLHTSRGVTLGAAVTIRCQGWHQNMRFVLYKDGNLNTLRSTESDGYVAEFPIHSVSQGGAGSYRCQYHTKSHPPVWSWPSDPVQLVGAELSYSKGNITLYPSEGVALGGAVTIRCWCGYWGGRVLLNKDGDPAARRMMDVAGKMAQFFIHNVNRRDAGSYSCQCRTPWGPPVWSEPSNPVELVVAEKTDPAGPQQPDPSMLEPQGEGVSGPTVSGPIIAGVIAGAAGLLLLLLLAFLCHRRTRARTGPAVRQSRESEAADTVYAYVGQGKLQDVLEPDSSPMGLIYAELDHQVLQAKQGALVPAPEPILYAAISTPPLLP